MSVLPKAAQTRLRDILDFESFSIQQFKKDFYLLKHHKFSKEEMSVYRKYVDEEGVFYHKNINNGDMEKVRLTTDGKVGLSRHVVCKEFTGKESYAQNKVLVASTFYDYNPKHHIIIMRDGDDSNSHPSNILVLTKEKALEIVIKWLQRKEPEREFKILDTEIYSPFYIASDEGQIFSLMIMDYLKPNKQESGYIKIELRLSETKERLPKSMQLHRLIYETFRGTIQEGYEIDHIDSNPSNNSIGNLQTLTSKQNQSKLNMSRRKNSDDNLFSEESKPQDALWPAFHPADEFESSWKWLKNSPLGDFSDHELSISGNVRSRSNKEYVKYYVPYGHSTYRQYQLRDKKKHRKIHIYAHTLVARVFRVPIHEDLEQDMNQFQYHKDMTALHFEGGTNWEVGCVVDHVNGNRRDNSCWNLRILNQKLNTQAACGQKVVVERVSSKEIKRFNSLKDASKDLGISIRVRNDGKTRKNAIWDGLPNQTVLIKLVNKDGSLSNIKVKESLKANKLVISKLDGSKAKEYASERQAAIENGVTRFQFHGKNEMQMKLKWDDEWTYVKIKRFRHKK